MSSAHCCDATRERRDPCDEKQKGTHRSGIDGEMQQAVTLPPQAKKVRIPPAVQHTSTSKNSGKR